MTKREMNFDWDSKSDFSGLLEEVEQQKRDKGETGVRAEAFRSPIDSNFGVNLEVLPFKQMEQMKPAYTLPALFWEEDSQAAMDALNDEITAQVMQRLSEDTRPTKVLMDEKVRARMVELLKWKYPDISRDHLVMLDWWHDDVLMVHLRMVACPDAELFVPRALPDVANAGLRA